MLNTIEENERRYNSYPDRLKAHLCDEILAGRRWAHEMTPITTTTTSSAPVVIPLGAPYYVNFNNDLTLGFSKISIKEFAKSWEDALNISNDKKETQRNTDSISLGDTYDITINALIAYVRNHLGEYYSSKLADRLEVLRKASEEDSEQEPINIDSLQYFIEFLKTTAGLRLPGVVLSSSGNLIARWRKSNKERLVAEFLPTGRVHYVVFSRESETAPIDRGSAEVSVKSLLKKVEPFNILPCVYLQISNNTEVA